MTFEQSRIIGDRYVSRKSYPPRVLRDANIMRLHGTRLSVAEKNIGKREFSINSIQSQFLPIMLRPPPQVCADITIMKKDLS